MHNRYVMTSLIWFHSVWHEVLKKKDIQLSLFNKLRSLVSHHYSWRRQPRGTQSEYFTKSSVKVQKDKDKSVKDCLDKGIVSFGSKTDKQNRDKMKLKATRKGRELVPFANLGKTKVHFSAWWQVIDKENRRKYDNMTEHKKVCAEAGHVRNGTRTHRF